MEEVPTGGPLTAVVAIEETEKPVLVAELVIGLGLP